nr:MAG TPA: hypothetical protein [Cressdnaviricota sp.]
MFVTVQLKVTIREMSMVQGPVQWEKDPRSRTAADVRYGAEHGAEEGPTWRKGYLRNLWDEKRWYDHRGLDTPDVLGLEIEYYTSMVNLDDEIAHRNQVEEWHEHVARLHYSSNEWDARGFYRRSPIHGWSIRELEQADRAFQKDEQWKAMSKEERAKAVRRERFWKKRYEKYGKKK